MDDLRTILKKAGVCIKEFVIESIERYYDTRIEDAKAYQRKRDVSQVVSAFIELKQSEVEIYRLLEKYFGIDSITEANEYLSKAKIRVQISKLREYMISQGMTRLEYKNYSKDNHIEEKLEQNPKLLEISVQKLIVEIEKREKRKDK